MSDIMLHAVLNMPPELWCDSPIDVMQRHSRYVQASQYIDELIEQRDKLADKLAKNENFLKECLHAMPCSYIPNHTVENLPAMIKDQAQMLGEECARADSLEQELGK